MLRSFVLVAAVLVASLSCTSEPNASAHLVGGNATPNEAEAQWQYFYRVDMGSRNVLVDEAEYRRLGFSGGRAVSRYHPPTGIEQTLDRDGNVGYTIRRAVYPDGTRKTLDGAIVDAIRQLWHFAMGFRGEVTIEDRRGNNAPTGTQWYTMYDAAGYPTVRIDLVRGVQENLHKDGTVWYTKHYQPGDLPSHNPQLMEAIATSIPAEEWRWLSETPQGSSRWHPGTGILERFDADGNLIVRRARDGGATPWDNPFLDAAIGIFNGDDGAAR